MTPILDEFNHQIETKWRPINKDSVILLVQFMATGEGRLEEASLHVTERGFQDGNILLALQININNITDLLYPRALASPLLLLSLELLPRFLYFVQLKS